eukprot:6327625-Lingulodinium_polyedra.AAC.1
MFGAPFCTMCQSASPGLPGTRAPVGRLPAPARRACPWRAPARARGSGQSPSAACGRHTRRPCEGCTAGRRHCRRSRGDSSCGGGVPRCCRGASGNDLRYLQSCPSPTTAPRQLRCSPAPGHAACSARVGRRCPRTP